MKKRLLLDRPYVGDRGQYTFFDDASTDYLDSNGIPQNYDKFSDKDLYSVSQDDTINNYIVESTYWSMLINKINNHMVESTYWYGQVWAKIATGTVQHPIAQHHIA